MTKPKKNARPWLDRTGKFSLDRKEGESETDYQKRIAANRNARELAARRRLGLPNVAPGRPQDESRRPCETEGQYISRLTKNRRARYDQRKRKAGVVKGTVFPARVGKETGKRLSAMKLKFLDYYLLEPALGPCAAARKAGFSEASSRMASAMLREPWAIEKLAERRAKLEAKVDTSVERIVRELATIAFADPKDLFNAHGSLLRVTQMPEAIRRAIHTVEVESSKRAGLAMKFKLSPKIVALELLGRWRGMFTNQVGVSMSPGISVNLIRELFAADRASMIDTTARVLPAVMTPQLQPSFSKENGVGSAPNLDWQQLSKFRNGGSS
jgi:phage terminase small subunit